MSLPWGSCLADSSAPFLGSVFICDDRSLPSAHVESSHCWQLVFSVSRCSGIKSSKIFSRFIPRYLPIQTHPQITSTSLSPTHLPGSLHISHSTAKNSPTCENRSTTTYTHPQNEPKEPIQPPNHTHRLIIRRLTSLCFTYPPQHHLIGNSHDTPMIFYPKLHSHSILSAYINDLTTTPQTPQHHPSSP
ncbi:hypothetical protein QBC41DRAFT_317619 [Cercophora samala]|uniref:Uncharacterized protein n=1 Tax=Cercophora samala TaxID=330535 RepID=A0AA40DEB4_9PEZI|nr:hypothetical protein QBC41DRAFT_317619 [Cercophora samala]